MKTLITYNKTNLDNRFSQSSKSLVGSTIFILKKPNRSFWLYVCYRDLNITTIKNWYALSLISESLD